MLHKLWQFIKNPVAYIQNRRALKRRLDELRNRDPYIYK